MISNKNYYIDQLNSSKAYQFTSYYHYSGVGFKKAKINLGIFRKTDNMLVGVMQWGISAQEGIRLDRYVKEPLEKEQYLELNRFCMADSEGKNAESQAISLGIKWIKHNRPDIKLLVSYSGRVEGNYGYIYQATSWEYLGYFISNGFWEVDGQEKHQITLWYHYQKHGDTKKSFRDAICDMYSSVKQTSSKQFIYIWRLDKKLTPASEILPYPKPSSEYPICTNVTVYKDEQGGATLQAKEPPIFFYVPNEPMFTRRTLIRQGIIVKEKIAAYSRDGELEVVGATLTEVASALNITTSSISKALKDGKMSCGYFFRRVPGDIEAPQNIEVPWLCEIDGLKFFKATEVADYCQVSRQAASGSVKRKSKKINGKEILWNEAISVDKT